MIGALIYQILFYVFAAVLIASAVTIIVAQNPVKMVLALVVACVASAGLWIQLQAEFLGLILIVVYVGAVMTLFLFVVMMLNLSQDKAKPRLAFAQYMKKVLPYALVIFAVVILMLLLVAMPERFGLAHYAKPAFADVGHNNIQALGLVLYHQYIIPFELAACLLFVAIIVAIYLTHRPPQNRKKQRVSAQISVTKQQRLRIINYPKSSKSIKKSIKSVGQAGIDHGSASGDSL